MASKAVKSGDDNEAFALNLTPMIDVVFQLIIFFMCAMKFKTLEKKIEAYLPKDRGMAKTPERIEEKVTIKVVIKQEKNEGVPNFWLFNENVGRTASDTGSLWSSPSTKTVNRPVILPCPSVPGPARSRSCGNCANTEGV